MRVIVKTELNLPIVKAWELLKQTDTLARVAAGVMTYEGLAEFPAEWAVGVVGNLRPRLWGMAATDHFVELVESDPVRHIIKTEEYGGSITRWSHEMRLIDLHHDQCTLVDTIDIEARRRTFLVAAFAHYFYRHRHRQWQKLAHMV
jgi:hypothetical protein